VGGEPDPDAVDELLDRSVIVSRGKSFRLYEGGFFNTLSYFWAPGSDIILTADEKKDTLVSVLTPAVLPKRIRHHFNAHAARPFIARSEQPLSLRRVK